MPDLSFKEDRDTANSSKGGSKMLYRDFVMGSKGRVRMDEDGSMDMREIFDDDEIEKSNDRTWFGIGMTWEEKIKAHHPWCNSLIIKLVGRSIGYHYLWRCLQEMWRTQGEPLLIDLGFDYFIVKLSRREEYEKALSEGPWTIGDNYLHVQRWRHNLNTEMATARMLLV